MSARRDLSSIQSIKKINVYNEQSRHRKKNYLWYPQFTYVEFGIASAVIANRIPAVIIRAFNPNQQRRWQFDLSSLRGPIPQPSTLITTLPLLTWTLHHTLQSRNACMRTFYLQEEVDSPLGKAVREWRLNLFVQLQAAVQC